MNKAYLKSNTTSKGDEVITPRYAVEPIVKHLKARGFKNIWCPFDKEDSQFVRVLRREGFAVINSHIDINKKSNFFNICANLIKRNMTFPTKKHGDIAFDCIVSNPPFSIKDKILERLYSLGKPFMMLLPVQAIQSKKRVALYMKHGLELLCFDKRVNYYTWGDMSAWKTSNHFASAYYCWNVLPSPLIFEKLEPKQEGYYAE